MKPAQRIEVICLAAGCVKIKDRYLLVAKRSQYRASKGNTRIWEPPNGILQASPSGLAALYRSDVKSIVRGSFALRLTVSSQKELSVVRAWFATRAGRETAPLRTINDYLIEEWKPDQPLLHPDMAKADWEYVDQSAYVAQPALRTPGPKALVIVEIYNLSPTPKAAEDIARIAQQHNAPFALVDADEINQGRRVNATGDEIIGPLAEHMLDPLGDVIQH